MRRAGVLTRLKKTRVELEGAVHEKLSLVEDEEPKPWDAEAELEIVGKSFAKIDGPERVTGSAIYTADIQLPGMLHAKALRSPYANARVKRIDASKAASYPGVRSVITHENILSLGWLNDTRILDGTARFAGEEVAVVVADDEETAEDAISLIEVEYEVLPFVVDAENASKGTAPIIHGENNLLGGAPRRYHRGDVDRGLAEADVVVEGTFTTQTAVHNCMETHGTVANWDCGHLIVWESTQSIADTREHLAAVFNLPLDRVRVICRYMGGGFGSKQRAGKHTMLAALLSKTTRRPVRMVLTRREDNLMTGNRQATVQHLRLGAKHDGTLTAIDLTSTGEVGAYSSHSSLTEGPAQTLYDCQNVRTDNKAYFTNMGPAVAFRGPGYVEGSFALESLLDELTEKLGIDPL
jgi:xanthine dehydrogenase YagR molybdenum-binding subunit